MMRKDLFTSFLMGKAKLAPTHGHMELCAAVLATEIAESIRDQLDIPPSNFHFFTDSKVVLGYISNESRRFYLYVANRVGPSQWHFFKTECNPADVATRSINAAQLKDSAWICGPMEAFNMTAESGFDLVNPDEDAEIRPEPEVISHKQEVKTATPFSDRFSRFSSWYRLVLTIALIKNWAGRKRN